jgi:hypothetical protein
VQHVHDFLGEQHLEPHDLPRRFPAEQRDHRIGAERVARKAHRDVGVAFSFLLQLNVVLAAAAGLERSDGRRQTPRDSQRSNHLQRRYIDDALGFFFARNVLVGGERTMKDYRKKLELSQR